jgi:catechol 2,3-dioxygenase-like lactoylglutathione lyase family enzyme
MTDLQTLPNIGPTLAGDLRAVGVPDAETLHRIGAAEAARRLAEAGRRDCTHATRALQAALAGVRWTTADPAVGRPGSAVLGVDNVLFAVGDLDTAVSFYATELGLPLALRLDDAGIALCRLGPETPGLLLRRVQPGDATGGGRVWLEVRDAQAIAAALSTADPPFRVATGWTVEITDPWGNVVGFTDYTSMPERGRPAVSDVDSGGRS